MVFVLSENDKHNLIRNLNLGRVVLVTGAGFSKDATNAKQEHLPDATALASDLWAFLYGTPYDEKTSLRTLYEAGQTHQRGVASLRQFLFDSLHATQWPQWYQTVTRWFWHRIYTFNADDLLEQVYASEGTTRLQTIIAPDHFHERDQFLRSRCSSSNCTEALQMGAP
jgi:hypothetical protein